MNVNSITIGNIEIIVFRDDLNHPTVSGNKLHKLAPNLELARAKKCSRILSFGGPFSNHLHSLAWACKESGFGSIGVVRGELHSNLTATLRDCEAWGMRLIPSSRKNYRAYQEALALTSEPCLASEFLVQAFSDDPEHTLVLPEGGSNTAAIESLSKAYSKIFQSRSCQGLTHVICATGTGATLAGLYKATPEPIRVIGIQAVAEHHATLTRIHSWLAEKPTRLSVKPGHLGGFGKISTELLQFIDQFEAQFNIPLDPVYNGKAMLKISQMVESNMFKENDKILFIHTGGLQGKRSLTA